MRCKLKDITNLITKGSTPRGEDKYSDSDVVFLRAENITDKIELSNNKKYITKKTHLMDLKRSILAENDILITIAGSLGRTGIVSSNILPANINQAVALIRLKKDQNAKFIYFYLKQKNLINTLIASSAQSVQPNLNLQQIGDIEVELPDNILQEKIATFLSNFDDKIELNNKINKNLEEQLKTIFCNIFSDKINSLTENNSKTLNEIVKIIDNRGKTPQLDANNRAYPIIDVGALKGEGRILNYSNCTKFVSELTYNTFFRNGHPQKYDTLLSTVGSLAEMKLFIKNRGCIAQNVVAIRTNELYQLYIYQYLQFIKNDLIAYDIGSVQPSIKVTHIIKHKIYIPLKEEIDLFNSLAFPYVNILFNINKENENLILTRDLLLPKLMSGEIDVSKIDI